MTKDAEDAFDHAEYHPLSQFLAAVAAMSSTSLDGQGSPPQPAAYMC